MLLQGKKRRMSKKSSPVLNLFIFIALILTLIGNKLTVSAGLILSASLALRFDRKAFKRLGKPKFWVFTLTIIVLAGMLLGKNPRMITGIPVSMDGLLAGLIMSIRAFTLILCFVMISRTITRDRFLQLTTRIGLPHYVPAFQTALETLPRMKEAFQESRRKGKRMFGMETLIGFLLLAKQLTLNPVKDETKVFGVTGGKEAGKTTLLKQTARIASEKGIPVGGYIQQRFNDEANNTPGYKVVSIVTGEELIIAEKSVDSGFNFNDKAFEAAADWLKRDISDCSVLLVDEMGSLESRGEGHLPGVMSVLRDFPGKIWVIALRKDRLEQLVHLLGIDMDVVIDLDKDDAGEFIEGVLSSLSVYVVK